VGWRGIGTRGRREEMWKGCGRVNIIQIHTYINGKTIPVEAISGMGAGDDKGEW
jgi:hypothetical protein